MRQDQLQRLRELQEKLADRFILEADPAEWAGAGKAPRDMTQQERGDAWWMKKNAMGTGGVLKFVTDTLDKAGGSAPAEGGDTAADADLGRAVREAERRSAKLVQEALARAKRKPEFDKRVHGKG